MKQALVLLFLFFVVAGRSSMMRSIAIDDPNDVILGKWSGSLNNKPFVIEVQKIKSNKAWGYFYYDNKKIELDGIIGKGVWDQPCSKAFEVTFKEKNNPDSENTFIIKFVGYQKMESADEGVDCSGKFMRGEASGTWLRPCCSDEALILTPSSEKK